MGPTFGRQGCLPFDFAQGTGPGLPTDLGRPACRFRQALVSNPRPAKAVLRVFPVFVDRQAPRSLARAWRGFWAGWVLVEYVRCLFALCYFQCRNSVLALLLLVKLHANETNLIVYTVCAQS